MTEPNTPSSPGRARRRSEFIDFYVATYPAVTGELLALTGSVDIAHATAGATYARAWQAWPSLCASEWPAMWVRADACRRVARPLRVQRLLERGLPVIEPVELDPEDEVLVAGLQRLPTEQRLPLVLHYMAQLPVDTVVEWFGGEVDQVEADLDAGFDALVGILDWPDDPAAGTDDAVEGDAYEWTAEALEDSAQRLRECLPTPPVTLAFRRAAVKRVTRRGAPATAAAAAACVGLVVYFSPAPAPSAAAAAFTAPPPTATQASEPVEALPPAPPSDTATPASTEPVQRPVTTRRSTATSRIAPSLASAAGSAAESTIAATTGGTTTAATTTSPAGTTTSSTTSTATSTTTSATTTLPRTSTSTASESVGTENGSSATTTPGTTLPGTSTSSTTSAEQTSTSETEDPETDESETDDSETDAPETTTITETQTVTVTAPTTVDETETETETEDADETDEPGEGVTTPSWTGTTDAGVPSVAVGQVAATSTAATEVLVGSPSHTGG